MLIRIIRPRSVSSSGSEAGVINDIRAREVNVERFKDAYPGSVWVLSSWLSR